ncbi:hypothetical protein BJY00DRAFT_320067 [Aspergillus carlsbadensis]|nr:hypothetical protein BJY00DRAFT_320067 [Aspergillus carlsbadensis]
MRLHWHYMGLLAIALGVLLQAAARAVPGQDVSLGTLTPRLSVPRPPKAPVPHSPVGGTVPKPGGLQAPDPIKPKPKPKPQAQPPIKPNPKPAPKPESAVCKRAGRCTTLDDPTWYTASSMDKPYLREPGDKMAHGWVDWKPPYALAQAHPQAFRRSLLSLTKRLYDGLQAEGRVIGPGGHNLVAALYVPERGVFLSTTPRGKAADDLLADWRTAAPRLYAQTGGRRVSPTTNPGDPQRLHAEDGVIYRFEKNVQHRGYEGEQIKGSRIFVYGKRGGYDQEPGEVRPCAPDLNFNTGQTSTGRNPSCDQVLFHLDVSTAF